jgi:hypothetical protein
MIEPMGILLYGYEGEDDVSVLLGEDHDDVEFRFITLVGGTSGETLRFESSDGMTVGEFFEALDDEEENPTETAIIDFLKKERDAAVLVAFDGEPRTFELEDEE